MKVCQALFDAGIYPIKDERESKPDMTFVLEGRSEPLNDADIEPDDAALIASVMAERRIASEISVHPSMRTAKTICYRQIRSCY